MIFHIIHFLIFYTASAHNLKVLNYQNPAKTIVQDLIDSWKSPIGYLESRGFLPKVIKYVPDLNHDNAQKNSPQGMSQNNIFKNQYKESPVEAEPEIALWEIDHPSLAETDRLVRSFDDQDSDEMKKMFGRLFSSNNDDTISDEIRSKLDVSWDMNQIKASALEEANKCYEKFCIRRTQNEPHSTVTDTQFDSAIDTEIAELYPSVLSKKDDVKKKDVRVSSPYRTPYHLVKGFGKILGSPELGYRSVHRHVQENASKPKQDQKVPHETQ